MSDGSRLPLAGSNAPSPDGPIARAIGPTSSPGDVVVAYHERTKHHFHRYAPSPGRLDWATQPDPFRRYAGAPSTPLPLNVPHSSPAYWELFVPGRVAPAPLTLETLARFFRCALSLTAWKQIPGSTWSLRANPSSGNLHPTEGYAILPPLEGVHPHAGIFHYAPKEHALERRAELTSEAWAELAQPLLEGSFFVGLSSIHWRESWKYGERAFRYCQHDVGHALAALRLSAATLGWQLSLVPGVGDAELARLLGLDRDADFGQSEREAPDLFVRVITVKPDGLLEAERAPSEAAVSAVETGARWSGEANSLSVAHRAWPAIEEVAQATRRGREALGAEDFSRFPEESELFGTPVRSGTFSAEQVILGRRSAVRMDGETSISAETFHRMLARLVPTRDRRAVPWDAIPWSPRIHLGLFVHRVDGLTPGLYALVRDPAQVAALRSAMRPEFAWARPPGCPPALPLYLLEEGDARALATRVSCDQDIAGDGAFSLGMIAEYQESLATFGPSFYRNLFWEAGVVGQVLYLEAEEAGVRGTGIGCYFDDAVHRVFGLTSRAWQSLYHFTVGGPVEDVRLTTLPAYGPDRA